MKWLEGRAQKRSDKEDRLARTDALTGFPNRLYFKETYGDDGLFLTMRYKSVAVVDVDHFVETGDEEKERVIETVARLSKESMGDKCEIFRWGEDSFVSLMEWSMEFGYGVCTELCRKVEKETGVTISVGITDVRLKDTIKKHYHRAMQGCYLVKEMGGNGVKRV